MTVAPAAAPATPAEEGFYVDDVAFASGFIIDQTPLLIATAAAMGGFRPPAVSGAFRYCDLGCGDGTTVCALAALNPGAEFVGIDFNAGHVATGTANAERLGLRNARFIQASFTDLGGHGDLGEFDLISMNGIYAWLEEAPRQGAVAFVRRHLRSGGLFYVEYTALPGMAAVPPLWRLIQTLVPAAGRSSRQRAEDGLAMLEILAKRGMGFLAANPRATQAARHYLGQVKADREAALDHFIHNAMASGFRPRFFDAMAAEMAEAGLQFAGRTALALNDIELAVPPSQVPTFRELRDPIQRQLLVDYIRNEQNRRDVFIKDAQPDPEGAAAFLTQQLRLLGRSAPEALQPEIPVIGGHGVSLKGPIYDALRPAFEEAPAPAASVALPAGNTPELSLRAVQRLIASDQYFLCLPAPEAAIGLEPATAAGDTAGKPQLLAAVNRWLLDMAVSKLEGTQLGSPLTGGTAIALSPLEALLLDAAIEHGWEGCVEALEQHLASEERKLPSARGPIAANKIKRSDLEQLLELLRGRKLTNMQRLGILS